MKKIPSIFAYPFPGKSLLGELLSRNATINDAARGKWQKDDDRNAKLFLDDMYDFKKLTHILGRGDLLKTIANTSVTIGEAALLSGIPRQALEGAAQNVFKLQDVNSFPLQQLADLTGHETVLAFLFPWRESYQACVKSYIRDWMKDEYQAAFTGLCATYFDMNRDDAKHFEASLHVLVGYFKMYPPKKPQEETANKEEPEDKHLDATDSQSEEENAQLPQDNSQPESDSLLLLPIKKRVSTEGQGNSQVKNTCQENFGAASYVEKRQEQGLAPEEIAGELKKAGGGMGVIGCLMNPACKDVAAARDHGKYLLRKVKS